MSTDDPRDRPSQPESSAIGGSPRTGASSYREYFERSADAILIIDGGSFVDCNEATVEMLRYPSKDEILRTHPSELSPSTQPDGRDSYEKAEEMISLAFDRGNHRFEWSHRRADGEVFPVEVLLTAVEVDGRPCLHVVWRDITERKALEAQLRQSQKMEAIGKLAGGVAHDFNNLLMVINGNAEMLEEALDDHPDLAEQLREIRRSGERAADLTHQLLAFSRQQVVQPRVVDLDELTRDTESLLRRLIGENFRLDRRPASSPLLVTADPGQLQQVIVNLVTNARDSMPLGGTIRLHTRRQAPTRSRKAPTTDGSYAVLSVRDEGIGMDDQTCARAFDPFFTTKEMGRGTGLGLSMAYGIVRQADGQIQLHSRPGNGTTAEVWLPLAKSHSTTAEATLELDETRPCEETILVVEDEKAVARLLVDALARQGYRVLEACDGVEALAVFEAAAAEVDLVVTDVVMPRMGGPELVRRLREAGHRPGVLFVSGYTDDSLGEIGEEDELLTKPFAGQELLAAVRRLLGQPAS